MTRILLAEDDNITTAILKEQLEQWQYEVVCAKDGQLAWEILQTPDAPKLIILDWQMPEITGLEICKRLRAQTDSESIYIIMLTCLSEPANIVEGLKAGADDYLTKPCDPFQLQIRLKQGERILRLQAGNPSESK